MNNVLYDRAEKRITAVLDFDWSCVSHPAEEFLSGLWDVGGGIHERVGKLRPMVLSGDFGTAEPNVSSSSDERRAWAIAKMWNDAVAARGCTRPSTIAGIRGIQALKEMERMVCPFDLSSEVMLKRLGDDAVAKKRAVVEKNILEWLSENMVAA